MLQVLHSKKVLQHCLQGHDESHCTSKQMYVFACRRLKRSVSQSVFEGRAEEEHTSNDSAHKFKDDRYYRANIDRAS